MGNFSTQIGRQCRWIHLLGWVVLLALALRPLQAAARAVISEVMWMGSDLSTSDEWVEITGLGGSGSAITDLKGWTLTRLNSSGVETPIIQFGSGDTIGSGEILVVSRFALEQSRLGPLPFFAVASGMSLPNTKLLLRLRNASGVIMDLVDDGIGNPFAGANPTGGMKASMERINLWGSGGLVSNWRTAMTFLGWDDGAQLRGTPGFLNGTGPSVDVFPPLEATSLTGAMLGNGSGAVLIIHWKPSASLDLASQKLTITPPLQSGEGNFALGKSASGLLLSGASAASGYTILVQSVDLIGNVSVGEEVFIEPFYKTEIIIHEQQSSSSMASSSSQSGSMAGSSSSGVMSSASSISSSLSTGSGSSSQSPCTEIQCITTVSQSSSSGARSSSSSSSTVSSSSSSITPLTPTASPPASVVVRSSSSSAGAASLCTVSEERSVRISEVFPRPVGEDAVEEWIELENTGDDAIDLCGWWLDDADGGSKAFSLTGEKIPAGAFLVLRRPQTGLALNDTGDRVRLFAPAATLQGMQLPLRAGQRSDDVLLDEIAYSNATVGLFYAREGNGFHWTLEGTPGAANRIREPATATSKAGAAAAYRVQVTSILDGDTFDALTISGALIRVRLIGVDAPELGSPQPLLHDNAEKAKQLLESLIKDKIIELEFDTDRTDTYGRTLAYPLRADGHTVQEDLLRAGFATVVKKYKFVRRDEFLGYESQAKLDGLGIWAVEKAQTLAFVDTGSTLPRSANSVLEVIISEVYPAPLTGSGILETLQKEWIELFNPTDHIVDLSGWTLDDAREKGSKPWTFPLGFLINPFSYSLIFSQQSGLKLNNDADEVWLTSPDGTVSDYLEYEKLKKGESFGRVVSDDDHQECVLSQASPDEANVCMQEKLIVSKSASPKKTTRVVTAKPTKSTKSQSKSVAEKKSEILGSGAALSPIVGSLLNLSVISNRVDYRGLLLLVQISLLLGLIASLVYFKYRNKA